MKTNNPFIDTLVENQTKFVNNWMDSAKKMQSAFTNGNITTEGQSLYKEYFDRQMDVLNSMKENGASTAQPQEFFKNLFNQQATFAKQMADFNQSINNSYASFGKPAQDYMSNFGQSNTTFTNLYNNWMNTLNSSYDSMSRNMSGGFNKDVFSNFMQGNQMYGKMQEFFQPMLDMMQKGQFNMDAFKNHFAPETYTNLSRQMFGNMYDQSAVKGMYDNAIKQLQDFFSNQNNLSKEYVAQMQNLTKEFPQMLPNNGAVTSLKEFYTQMNNVFSKTFEPLMKLVNAGKEKDNAEAMINMMDRVAAYTIKQAELQAFLQETAKKGVEKIAAQYAEKFSTPEAMTSLPSAQDMYSEWVKVNETLFTELFASEEFSKVKGDTLNLTNELKKNFEKQFETSFANTPFVFKSEVEELNKTIYDLRKQVKELQAKVTGSNAAVEAGDDEKKVKSTKK